MSIFDLEQQKQKVHQTFSKIDAALHTGNITQEERDALLHHYYMTTNEREAILPIDTQIHELRTNAKSDQNTIIINKTTVLVVAFIMVMAGLFGVMFYSVGGITGAIVLDTVQTIDTTYFTDTSLNITLNSTTRVSITGTAQGVGEVTITLNKDGTKYALYEYDTSPPTTAHASMTKAQYLVGEPALYTIDGEHSIYLMTATDATPIENTGVIEGLSAGSYTLTIIVNETENSTNVGGIHQENLKFTVVESVQTSLETFDTCGTLCSTNLSGDATIEITTSGDARVLLNNILLSSQENRAPQLVQEIPDVSGIGTINIDLHGAFTDADNDELLYESTHHDGMTETITNGVLSITGTPGTYTYVVYVSDLKEITPSNIFSITLIEEMTNENETNEIIVNDTNNNDENNNTLNDDATNENSINITIDTFDINCSDQDPNMRPLSCIQNNESTYFKHEEINIENKEGTLVGQLTPIGNLLIKGGIVENTLGRPARNDYQLGYMDEDGDFIATVWISTENGNLYMKGKLSEANGNIPLEDGYSAIANSRGIVLALINRNTGDLIVRGNVIPYRRSFG